MNYYLVSTPPENSSLSDLWCQFCAQEGFIEGSTQEKKIAFMADFLGIPLSFGSANDIERQFWLSLVP